MCHSFHCAALLPCVIAILALDCPALAESNEIAADTAAEAKVTRLESLYKSGLIPKSDLEEAQDQAALLRAQHANDEDQVAKINLSRAERRLSRLAILRKADAIPQSDLEEAQDQVALAQAALAKDKGGVVATRVKMAERKLRRMEVLRKTGAVSQQELDQARNLLESLRKEAGVPNAPRAGNR